MRTTIATIAGTAALLTLSACSGNGGSDDETPDASETTSATSEPTADATTEPTTEPTEGAPAAGAGTPQPLEGSIEDTPFGDTITLHQVVRGFESETLPAITEDGGEFVLIEFEASIGEKYSGGLHGTFKLDGEEGSASQTTAIDTDLEAAGHTPFEDLDVGETGRGWIAVQVNSASPTYTLTYDRMGADVIGSDETIEPKSWDFPVE